MTTRDAGVHKSCISMTSWRCAGTPRVLCKPLHRLMFHLACLRQCVRHDCGSMYGMSPSSPSRPSWRNSVSLQQRPALAAGSAREVMTGDQTTPYGLRPGRSYFLPTGRSLGRKGENPGARAYHGAVTVGGKPTDDCRDAILRMTVAPARSGSHG